MEIDFWHIFVSNLACFKSIRINIFRYLLHYMYKTDCKPFLVKTGVDVFIKK